MTNDTDDDLTDTERQALMLANQIKAYREEAEKWATLAEHVDHDAAAQLASAYRDAWVGLVEQRQARLKDLNTQLGFEEVGVDE